MRKLITRCAAIAAALPAAALAFQPLITDDTGTQGKGGNQLEAGYNRTSDKAPGGNSVTHEIPLVYTRGVTDELDIYVGDTRMRIVPDAPGVAESGWSNPVIGAKWRFYENEASKLSFAIKPEVSIGVSGGREARGLGTGRTSYGMGLLMTQETGYGQFLANLQTDRTNYADNNLNASERRTQYRLSAAPVWDAAQGWKLALDIGVMTNPDRAAKDRMGYMELGTIYSPNKDLDFAFGLIRNNRDGDARSTQATMGVTWRFR